MVRFDGTKEERLTIVDIAKRAVKQFPELDFLDTQMDICATHANGCTLRLKDLLDADDFNFGHDIIGIYNHIDRETGKLVNCFLPRFSA